METMSIGGQQTYLLNLWNNVSSLELYTAYFIDGKMRDKFERISVDCYKIKPASLSLKYYLYHLHHFGLVVYQLYVIIKYNNIQIIITNGFLSYFFGCILKIVTRIKVVRLTGCDPARNEAFHFERNFNRVPLHKFTDLYFGWDDLYRQYILKGVDPKKLSYRWAKIHAVDTNLFYPEDNYKTRRLLQILDLQKEQNIIIGWHGRLAEDKEIWHTIEMLKELKKQGFDNFKFLIVGDGSSRLKIQTTLENYNLDNLSIFTGEINYEDINNYYRIEDVEVLLDEDPIGGSHIREAMACGKVVLTTNGASRFQEQFISHGKTGFLVDPDNMYQEAAKIIVDLHNNRNLLNTVGNNAATYVKNNFSFSKRAKIFESECLSLIGR